MLRFYPIILGLDWLHCHNPHTNWDNINLSLSCCNLSCSTLVVSTKGFGLTCPQGPTYLNSIATTVGLGLLTPLSYLQECLANSSTTSSTSFSSPFISSIVSWTSFSCSKSKFPPVASRKLSIEVVNPHQFSKYAKFSSLALIHFHTSGSPSYNLALMFEHSLQSTCSLPLYFLSPLNVNQFPPHWPYDIDIELEKEKSHLLVQCIGYLLMSATL